MKSIINKVATRFREERDDYLPLTAGSCSLCKTCTYPNEPCRYPELAIPSLESIGLLVSDVCKLAGLPYNNGPLTITFSSAILFKGEITN